MKRESTHQGAAWHRMSEPMKGEYSGPTVQGGSLRHGQSEPKQGENGESHSGAERRLRLDEGST